MSLISVANLQLLTDKLAALYDRWRVEFGVSTGNPVAGTDRYLADHALTVLTTTVDDYQQQYDMSQQFYTLATKCNRKDTARLHLTSVLASIEDHMSQRGSSVAASIVSLATFLSYYNGGSGGSAYSSMLHPVFGDLWYDIYASRLPDEGLFHPGVHPYLDATNYANGFGTRAVGGAFADGASYESTPLYSELEPMLEVIVNFSGGDAPPTFTVAGTDNTGAALNWTATGGSNNPEAAVSTTITPALNAMGRQTFAVASASGIVIGSTLKINAGLTDEEVIVVENVSGTDITAVCMKAHGAGAALTGFTTLALTPATAGRRIRDVTGITIGITAHTAGAVRVVGKQQRQYNPDVA
jgi:hypothetical protein